MASDKQLVAVKALLKSLHEKVDLLSAEVQQLRAQGVVVAAEAADPKPETDAADDAAVEAASVEANPALDTVFAFVAAALIRKDEKCWSELERLTHSGSLLAPRSLDHLKAFSWKKLRVNARRYYKTKEEIQAARVEPAVIDEDTQIVKVFVAHGKGSSSPVIVARDSEAGGDWRIQACSL